MAVSGSTARWRLARSASRVGETRGSLRRSSACRLRAWLPREGVSTDRGNGGRSSRDDAGDIRRRARADWLPLRRRSAPSRRTRPWGIVTACGSSCESPMRTVVRSARPRSRWEASTRASCSRGTTRPSTGEQDDAILALCQRARRRGGDDRTLLCDAGQTEARVDVDPRRRRRESARTESGARSRAAPTSVLRAREGPDATDAPRESRAISRLADRASRRARAPRRRVREPARRSTRAYDHRQPAVGADGDGRNHPRHARVGGLE